VIVIERQNNETKRNETTRNTTKGPMMGEHGPVKNKASPHGEVKVGFEVIVRPDWIG